MQSITPDLPSTEDKRKHVERVLSSAVFSNAPVLKSFLQFITSQAEAGRSDEINEYAIAIQVFGKSPNFDPSSDTIVRTQAYRLRLKLKEFYEGEGKDSKFAIEIPKGHYVPLFQCRGKESQQQRIEVVELPGRPAPGPPPVGAEGSLAQTRIRLGAFVLAVCIAFAAGMGVDAWWSTGRKSPAVDPGRTLENQFWSGFLGSNRHIIVSFMDSNYLTSDTGALLPLRSVSPMGERGVPADAKAAQHPKLAALVGDLYYENGYAALGDMLAVNRLAMMFSALGTNTAMPRVHQVTLDDLRSSDLVFLGDFQDRSTVVWLPERWPWRFAFRNGTGIWGKSIVDTTAPPGTVSHFDLGRDPDSDAIRTDYALVSVIPSVSPGHRIVNLAGLTTSATQGAADFMASEAGLKEVLAAIGVKQNGRVTFPRFFQCVVRVEVAHGLDPMTTKYVAGAAFQPK